MSKLKLNKSDVLKLLQIYKKKECLWDKKNKTYKTLDLRQKAWKEMADEFKTSVENIKKKIKFLRTSFSAEKKKVESSKKSGSGDVYVPNLFYYNDISFISRTVVVRNTMENVSSESSTGADPTSQNTKYDSFAASSSKRARLSSERKYDRALEAIIASTKKVPEPADMFMSFGNSVGMQLKQLPIVKATRVMSEIQKLISDNITAHFISNTSSTAQLSSTPISFSDMHINKTE